MNGLLLPEINYTVKEEAWLSILKTGQNEGKHMKEN